MCLEMYEPHSVHFPSAPGQVWPASLKNPKVKLDLITDTDVLLMLEIGISGGICHALHRYVKTIINIYIKDLDKNNRSSYLKYLEVNSLCG